MWSGYAKRTPAAAMNGKCVARVGADIGLKCLKCQRGVLLGRDVFKRKVKEFVSKSD